MSHAFIYFILFKLREIIVTIEWIRKCGKLMNTDYEGFILVE